MGYRSEVTLVLTRNGLSALYNKIPDAMRKITEYADKFVRRDDVFLLCWGHIKWYDSYDEINAVEKALRGLDNDDYHFLRIGEDNDDTEEKGGYWDNPFDTYISRSINCDMGGSEAVDYSVFS